MINTRKLLSDARAAAARSKKSNPGTTARLRANLEAIETLRAEGASFADIASALAAQGVTQGKGDKQKPITSNRLTALYSQMKRVDAERARKRKARLDAIEPPAENETPPLTKRKLSPAAELDVQPLDNTGLPEPDEESIRRDNLKKSQRFVTKSAG